MLSPLPEIVALVGYDIHRSEKEEEADFFRTVFASVCYNEHGG